MSADTHAAPRRRPGTRTLRLCRSVTEACLGAAVNGNDPGTAIMVREADGDFHVELAARTVFGAIRRRWSDASVSQVVSVVVGTLDADQGDVWLCSPVGEVREEILEAAREGGHSMDATLLHDGVPVPPSVADPFALLDGKFLPRPADPSMGVVAWCEVDLRKRPEMSRDARIKLTLRPVSAGWEAVPSDEHGVAEPIGVASLDPGPGLLSLLAASSFPLTWSAFGSGRDGGRSYPRQNVVFEIPSGLRRELDAIGLP